MFLVCVNSYRSMWLVCCPSICGWCTSKQSDRALLLWMSANSLNGIITKETKLLNAFEWNRTRRKDHKQDYWRMRKKGPAWTKGEDVLNANFHRVIYWNAQTLRLNEWQCMERTPFGPTNRAHISIVYFSILGGWQLAIVRFPLSRVLFGIEYIFARTHWSQWQFSGRYVKTTCSVDNFSFHSSIFFKFQPNEIMKVLILFFVLNTFNCEPYLYPNPIIANSSVIKHKPVAVVIHNPRSHSD